MERVLEKILLWTEIRRRCWWPQATGEVGELPQYVGDRREYRMKANAGEGCHGSCLCGALLNEMELNGGDTFALYTGDSKL